MIFTSLPTIADAKPKEISGDSEMYVGETKTYKFDEGNENGYAWTIDDSTKAETNGSKKKEVTVTAKEAGTVKLSVFHDNNRKAEKTITIKEKNKVTENIE